MNMAGEADCVVSLIQSIIGHLGHRGPPANPLVKVTPMKVDDTDIGRGCASIHIMMTASCLSWCQIAKSKLTKLRYLSNGESVDQGPATDISD